MTYFIDDKELNLEAEDEKIEGKLQVGTVEGKAEYGKIEVKAEYRKLEGEAENGKVQDGILGEHEEHDERDDEKRDLAAEKHSIPKKVIQGRSQPENLSLLFLLTHEPDNKKYKSL